MTISPIVSSSNCSELRTAEDFEPLGIFNVLLTREIVTSGVKIRFSEQKRLHPLPQPCISLISG